jgi:hypothetical protein
VAEGQPDHHGHDGEDVGEPGDRGPGQRDVATLEVVEERADRGEQWPQHEDVVDQPVGDRVDHAEPEQEGHLADRHAVADVVERVEGGRTHDARDRAEAVFQRPWTNPRKKIASNRPTVSDITSSGTQSTGAGSV